MYIYISQTLARVHTRAVADAHSLLLQGVLLNPLDGDARGRMRMAGEELTVVVTTTIDAWMLSDA